MKRAFISFIAIILIAFCVSAKDVVVSGTVKSFATEEPIPTAAVFAVGMNLTAITMPDSVDTFYTDLNGNFSITIQVKDDDNIMISGALKEGYLVKTDLEMYFLGSIPAQVDLGDILLKTTADATDTLEVSGSVIDSINKIPVPNAKVVLTSGVIGDITIDSLFTNEIGEFVAKLPYIPGDNAMFNFMIYNVSEDLYIAKGDTATIPSNKEIDLGVIELVRINTPITPLLKNLSKLVPTHFSLYSLRGMKIYSGTINEFENLNKIKFSNQQFIIKYFKNDILIGTEKIINK